jgi:hypothetical protein
MEEIDKFIIKYFIGPLFTIIAVCGVIGSFNSGTRVTNYKWTTPEELQRQYRDKENEWYRNHGLDNTYRGSKYRSTTNYPNYEISDLENAEPGSDLFREYLEELDDRGIEIGSPEGAEIWNTYYK